MSALEEVFLYAKQYASNQMTDTEYFIGEKIKQVAEELAAKDAELSALRERVEALEELVQKLAPEEAMNQDEQGGCVWCGWSESMMYFSKNRRSDRGSMYADERPETHTPDCAWRLAREYINKMKA